MTTGRASTQCQVAVVGGGIAGTWLAYRLIQHNVQTVLMSADEYAPPMSRQWSLGLTRPQVLDCTEASAADVFADGSTTQDPAYQSMMVEHARGEFDQLTKLVEYTRFGEFIYPAGPVPGIRLGAGDGVVSAVLAQFEKLGGTVLSGRVTDLVVDGDVCLGLRYECDGVPGKVLCSELVLASGGICGLLKDGVGTNTGYLLGTYLRQGGSLANLELFNRFPLGDLDRKRPLYPFDLEGARPLRAGYRAEELENALETSVGDRAEIDVFVRYWIHNLDVPHTVELPDRVCRLGPIRGFSMGGAATGWSGTALHNVHATGECSYGLSTDSVSGKPFLSFMAMGGVLAGALADRCVPVAGVDFDTGQVGPGADRILNEEVRNGLDAFQDNRFSTKTVQGFAQWCVGERARRRSGRVYDNEDIDLLLLAEAYARSMLARTESRGTFYRPDFPAADPTLDNLVTVARYDAEADRVGVSLVSNKAK